jgi:hypothetical protein
MKTQLNEIKRMQQLAGVVNESQLNEEILVIRHSDGSTMTDNEFEVEFKKFLESLDIAPERGSNPTTILAVCKDVLKGLNQWYPWENK